MVPGTLPPPRSAGGRISSQNGATLHPAGLCATTRPEPARHRISARLDAYFAKPRAIRSAGKISIPQQCAQRRFSEGACKEPFPVASVPRTTGPERAQVTPASPRSFPRPQGELRRESSISIIDELDLGGLPRAGEIPSGAMGTIRLAARPQLPKIAPEKKISPQATPCSLRLPTNASKQTLRVRWHLRFRLGERSLPLREHQPPLSVSLPNAHFPMNGGEPPGTPSIVQFILDPALLAGTFYHANSALAGWPAMLLPRFRNRNAKSLPWISHDGNLTGQETTTSTILIADHNRHVLDTDPTVLVHMETLRRATLYPKMDPRSRSTSHQAHGALPITPPERRRGTRLFDLGISPNHGNSSGIHKDGSIGQGLRRLRH